MHQIISWKKEEVHDSGPPRLAGGSPARVLKVPRATAIHPYGSGSRIGASASYSLSGGMAVSLAPKASSRAGLTARSCSCHLAAGPWLEALWSPQGSVSAARRGLAPVTGWLSAGPVSALRPAGCGRSSSLRGTVLGPCAFCIPRARTRHPLGPSPPVQSGQRTA